MYKVAIVILNWNGAEMLKTFLPSVIRYSQLPDVAVYVADNGSSDNSLEVLRNHFPNVQLIILDKNYGFAEGYNRALNQVSAEYVVLLNSDVEVTPNWLDPLVTYMDANQNIVACQPKIRSWHNKEMFEHAGASGGFIDKYGYPFCRGRIMGVVEKDEGQYNRIIPIFWATGAALFIRLGIFQEVGGLDGDFFAHMEEIDLCWRLRNRGYNIVCIPQSTVYHVGGATLKKENPRKTYLNFRNNLVMLYKNLPDNELARIMWVRTLLDYLALLVFVAKGDVANAKAVLRARRDYKKTRAGFSIRRTENIKKTIPQQIPERTNYSILVQFYVKRKKYFSQLFGTNE
ncbi:glycosyltransferase family 2 protein [Bacteroides sp. 519]|uniref:glycosyltransferase family 2 protein n=1 Tax=Bacteroides sp. 519 TaxID=2302937 RepID=UPI0013D34F30|nr:glycosyltransferase family 2 protein [Bacteroides sp. 519]NDV58632.1 glycosyltransferase family 2 protein [Bacteroides sp. 519]